MTCAWNRVDILVRMAQFGLKIAKLCHIIGVRGFQDLRSPSTIMATALISKHGWFTLSWQMDYLKV